MKASGRGDKLPKRGRCCQCGKDNQELWCEIALRCANTVKAVVGGDRCKPCWMFTAYQGNVASEAETTQFRRFGMCSSAVEPAPPPFPMSALAAVTQDATDKQLDVIAFEQSIASHPAKDKFQAICNMVARRDQESSFVLGMLVENTTNLRGGTEYVANAVSQEAAQSASDGVWEARGANVSRALHRLQMVATHVDDQMLATYGPRLQAAVDWLRKQPPNWSKAQSLLSFQVRRRSRLASGQDSAELEIAKQRRAKVVCGRHLIGMACDGQCGYKYHVDFSTDSIVDTATYVRTKYLPVLPPCSK